MTDTMYFVYRIDNKKFQSVVQTMPQDNIKFGIFPRNFEFRRCTTPYFFTSIVFEWVALRGEIIMGSILVNVTSWNYYRHVFIHLLFF